MANSDRKIVRGVRVENKTYTTGMEDELAEALSADEAQRLSEKGYIQGKWASGKKAAVAAGPAGEDLESLTVVELKDKAREAGVEGFSTMKKDELIEALS